jgi:hypothetical protein
MTAGNWDDDFPPEGVTNLESGIYCIGGDVVVDTGQLTGDSVILVIEHGSVHFGGGAQINLTSPKSGELKGLLIYVPLDNHSVVALNASFGSNFKGTILAPSADIHLNGIGTTGGYHSQIVGYYIEVDGTDVININYKDDQNYDAFRMPEVLLSQ